MDINHRICEFNNKKLLKNLNKINIEYDFDDKIKSIIVNITESHQKWPEFKNLIKKYDLFDLESVKYSKKEIDSADWLLLRSQGHFGYPQPENNYEEISFETNNYCKRCGIFLTQKAPIRFRKYPKIKSHFFKLNWIMDEFFIKKEVKSIFEFNNIDVDYIKPVVHKNNEPILDYYQINIKHILPFGLKSDKLNIESCEININEKKINDVDWNFRYPKEYPSCNQIKYNYPTRDFIQFKSEAFDKSPDIVKSKEFFGSGGEAHRLVIISKKLKNIIEENNFRGVVFEPIKLI